MIRQKRIGTRVGIPGTGLLGRIPMRPAADAHSDPGNLVINRVGGGAAPVLPHHGRTHRIRRVSLMVERLPPPRFSPRSLWLGHPAGGDAHTCRSAPTPKGVGTRPNGLASAALCHLAP